MSVPRTAALLGVLVGMVGVAAAPLPPVRTMEDTLVLPALFHIRGASTPPRGVVLVTMDERSATTLGFAMPQREWPRRAHAALVSRLVERGAAAIAFDVEFFKASPDPTDDRLFAESIRRAGRVVLVERVEALKVGAQQVWERQDPIAVLKDAAAGVAAAVVPNTPVVAWTWFFLPTPQGELATLPVAALRTAAMTAGSASDRERWGSALTSLRARGATAYLNFYGPPGTVCSIAYMELVAAATAPGRCPLDGAIVLVGGGDSGIARAGQPDTYHAVYGGSDGVDFSGVELHATALANLLDGSSLRVLPASFVLLLLWGVLIAAGGYVVRVNRGWRTRSSSIAAAGVIVSAAAFYCAAAYLCFTRLHLLIPIGVPIVIQAPIAIVSVLLMRARVSQQQVLAVCLATDAAGSTELGQRLPHHEYARVMRSYIARLSASVAARSGEVLDPQGDGFVCIWRCAGDTSHARLQACLAALDVLEAGDAFDREAAADVRLPTRVAVTMGVVTILSDADRGAFQVYGDAMNLAARLRDLNTRLGTRFIACADVVDGLDQTLQVRPVTDHLDIKGVAQPPAIIEVIGAAPASGAHHAAVV